MVISTYGHHSVHHPRHPSPFKFTPTPSFPFFRYTPFYRPKYPRENCLVTNFRVIFMDMFLQLWSIFKAILIMYKYIVVMNFCWLVLYILVEENI